MDFRRSAESAEKDKKYEILCDAIEKNLSAEIGRLIEEEIAENGGSQNLYKALALNTALKHLQ